MNKHYWLILLAFLLLQLSPLAIAPLLALFGFEGTFEELSGLSISIGYVIGFIVIIWITLKTPDNPKLTENKADVPTTILWSVLGIILAFASQYAAAAIETFAFGIEPGSENTDMIVEMANAAPFTIFVVAVLGPIVEEIVFRMVIFGALYKRFGFWIGALGSGFVFALVHFDFTHLLVYLAMGVVFAWLYVKTKRIIVPIIAHVGINSFVMLVQVIFGEQLQEMIEQMEEMEQTLQFILGGWM
ncbi:CPBP family intramembrane glutamic endopeptidase [Alkalicoccus urumqiensis]|uniref:CPBP family intramembrane metalloprotease n=1 Tax=Alkalicoccus urumqiensis TaxID=1548213 RepID=A0A2P6MJC4_ALKUR|nr:type II CAAX endopeptidase family protein [Alkalicoccus urumqiensis]PRO66360.1 CPBP family intramembrane metalloprotease [Alkalicoccus urumqiensis]